MNLVKNAIEAMPSGGDLSLRARRADNAIELEIEDTGQGFPDETPVFDAFFTTKAKGTGLGLSIVHRIVTDHGGTIRVRSRPGQTCFSVLLPAAQRG
jgi:signal transduction histidine kinase